MEKIKALLAVAKQLVFDKTFPEPEAAFIINAETDIEKCEGIFGTRSTDEIEQKIAKKAIRAYLRRGLNAYTCTIKEYLKNDNI